MGLEGLIGACLCLLALAGPRRVDGAWLTGARQMQCCQRGRLKGVENA